MRLRRAAFSFNGGQRLRFHCWIACSSRWIAPLEAGLPGQLGIVAPIELGQRELLVEVLAIATSSAEVENTIKGADEIESVPFGT